MSDNISTDQYLELLAFRDMAKQSAAQTKQIKELTAQIGEFQQFFINCGELLGFEDGAASFAAVTKKIEELTND